MIYGGRLGSWAALGGAALSVCATQAFAAPLALSIKESAAGARLTARWTDASAAAPIASVSVSGGVLAVTFTQAFEADVAGLAGEAPETIAFARRESDGRTLRIALRRALQAKLVGAGPSQAVELSAPPSAPAQGAAAPPPLAVMSVGQRPEFTRLSFLFPAGATVVPLMKQDVLELRFSRPAEIDISQLNIAPPAFVRGGEKIARPGGNLALALRLEPGVRQRHFVEGPRVIVDLLPPLDAEAPKRLEAHAKAEAPKPSALDPDPTPKSGVVKVLLEEGSDATTIITRWAGPARAAAFRRGEAIWIVFDAKARLDISAVAQLGRRHQGVELVTGDGVVGLRLPAPPEMQVMARSEGREWRFDIAARGGPPASAAIVRRDVDGASAGGGARLVADFGRPGVVRWLEDPEIGDRFAAGLVAGPPRGVETQYATLEAAILPSAHGVAIETRADGVGAAFENGAVVVTRGVGLLTGGPALTPAPAAPAADVALNLAAWKGQDRRRAADVLAELQRTAAKEGFDPAAKAEARMALARFLLAQELAVETLGALRIAAINKPELELQPDYRLMRAAANLMIGRAGQAQGDLAAPALAEDASAALWRGYAAALRENWPEARRALETGRGALLTQPRGWRTRFNLALAEAGLELNDFAAADAALSGARAEADAPDAKAQCTLLEARLAQARGDAEGALAKFDALAQGRDEHSSAAAELARVRLRWESGKTSAADAVAALEALRFRWRGDALELETIQTLGHVYEEMGRWRDALGVMRAAASRFPDLPAARRLRLDMAALFERLFLDGEADKLEPIQALGLFYEFKDLTPVGAGGDRMIRLLSARLVRMDLLEQAAALLQHQVDNRLEGIAQAQVAVDLAAIYVAARQPERAVIAIESTRLPGVPREIAADRRLIEAKALVALQRYDHALELLERDTGADAAALRADIAWRRRDWEQAAAMLGLALQRHTETSAPLDDAHRALVLRAAIAAVLAGDGPGVARLTKAYASRMASTPDADAFEFMVSGVDPGDARVRDIAGRIGRTDLADRVLTRIKTFAAEKRPASPAGDPKPRA